MNQVLQSIKKEAERQAHYANTDGESSLDTSCDAAHWLQMAADEIERLIPNPFTKAVDADSSFWDANK